MLSRDCLLLGSRVRDVIAGGIITIDVIVDVNHYDRHKVDDVIADVNAYLNYLTASDICNLMSGHDYLDSCEDILNLLVSGYNTRSISVSVILPKKYNFSVATVMAEIVGGVDKPQKTDTFPFIVFIVCLLVILFIIKIKN